MDLPFYLTGGTLLHRFFYNYRYSDDLDFFVNGYDDFDELKKNTLMGLKKIKYEITNQSDCFLSIFVEDKLKIDFVNDIPFYYGTYNKNDIFPKLDNVLNILSNKLTCLQSRMQPKDLVDIWVIWRENKSIDWREIFTASQSKAAGIYPPQIARLISTFPDSELDQIKFVKNEYARLFIKELPQVIESIL
ncbi:MAG TPA: nucleotidyl transferase AbiEii/AbiGii toxin family protein [bacterium]|nr:nucleotidyl transferase AbiEii/AbiGii toxin family protein [bacterium]